jgi:hypothetical protein
MPSPGHSSRAHLDQSPRTIFDPCSTSAFDLGPVECLSVASDYRHVLLSIFELASASFPWHMAPPYSSPHSTRSNFVLSSHDTIVEKTPISYIQAQVAFQSPEATLDAFPFEPGYSDFTQDICRIDKNPGDGVFPVADNSLDSTYIFTCDGHVVRLPLCPARTSPKSPNPHFRTKQGNDPRRAAVHTPPPKAADMRDPR